VRKCHFCHEGIADVARVCPHCGADLIHRTPSQGVDEVAKAGAFAAFIKDRVATFGEDHPTITRRTVLQSAGLFVILVAIYLIYLQGIIEGMIHGPRVLELSDVMWPLAEYCLISGAPFAVLAAADRQWQSANAAPVALAAWVAVFWFISRKYGSEGCPMAFAFFFIPLIFSALAAHKIGRLRQSTA
jgi:zinc ribbon protein